MIYGLINQKLLADYARANQALVEEIIRDQKEQEEKTQLAQKSEQMLTAKEVAERLACSEDWVYRNAKKLPAVKLGHKNLRFSKTGLEKWLKAQQVKQ